MTSHKPSSLYCVSVMCDLSTQQIWCPASDVAVHLRFLFYLFPFFPPPHMNTQVNSHTGRKYGGVREVQH